MTTIDERGQDLLTCREVARLYKVNVETVRRWVRKGVIEVVQVGPYRATRIRRAEASKHFRIVPGPQGPAQ